LGGRRFGFIFKGLSGVSGERVLIGQESSGGALGSLLSQVPKKGPGAPGAVRRIHIPAPQFQQSHKNSGVPFDIDRGPRGSGSTSPL
jgi:hypothetical protein